MSEVLETLINQWVQADGLTSSLISDWQDEKRIDTEDIKIRIASDLVTQFKGLCSQRKVKQRFVLYTMIYEWVEAWQKQNQSFN